MIDLAELRPILEPLLTDENTASVLESIAAIDNEDFISRAELQRENEKYHTERMKRIVWGKENPKTEPKPEDTPEKQEPKAPTTFAELFKEVK